MAATAVLDIGKTNVKVVLFDVAGSVLWERSQTNSPLPGPPYQHPDVDGIWRFVLKSLREANGLHRIDAIVSAAHGAAGALISADGLVLPVLDYEDKGPEGVEDWYAKIRPPFDESLSPPAAGGLNLARQFAFQKWRFPEEFSRARHLLTYSQYWSWRLSGVAASEVTCLGCHTDLWAPQQRKFSSVVHSLGIAPLFPPVRPAWDVLGAIRRDVAAATGLDPGTRVVNGIHDSNASLLPHLLGRQSPFTVISTGTWVILMSVGLAFERLDATSDLYANVDATGAPVPCARFMGGREYAIISEGQSTSPDAASLSRIITSGALALPSFTSQAGTYANRQGKIIGSVAAADRPALATLHVALMTDDLLTRLGASKGDLVIEGSFGKNAAYCGLLAAFRPNQTVSVSDDQSGTARGAALLANWPQAPVLPADHAAVPLRLPGLAAYRKNWRDALS